MDARALIAGGWSMRRYTAELMRGLVGLDVSLSAWIAGWHLQSLRRDLSRELAALELDLPIHAALAPGKLLYTRLGSVLWARTRHLPCPSLLPRDVDVYHAVHWPFPLARRPPAVLTIHDLIALRRPEWATPDARALCRAIVALAPRAAQVIVDSDAVRADLLDLSPVDPERVTTVPLAVRAEAFAAETSSAVAADVRRRFGLERPYFLAVSTIEPRKNLPALITAYDLLCEGGYSDWDLQIIGVRVGPTPEFDALLARPRRGAVRVGEQASDRDLAALMQGAGGFVFVSLAEGFGLPVLEAFAAGCPVITSDTSSLPEVAGDAALLVDPSDPEAIAEAMRRLMTDPALAADLRRRGRARAAQFTWERTAKLTAEVYRRALG